MSNLWHLQQYGNPFTNTQGEDSKGVYSTSLPFQSPSKISISATGKKIPKKLAPKTWFIPLNNSMKVRKTTKPSLLQPINLSHCGLHTRSSERSFCHYLCTPSASAELERERNRDRKERSCRQREKGERVGVR